MFDKLVSLLLQVLLNNDKEQNKKHESLAKYVFSQNKDLEIIFLMSNLESKIKILDFLVGDKKL